MALCMRSPGRGFAMDHRFRIRLNEILAEAELGAGVPTE
jgi:hypothetical protein